MHTLEHCAKRTQAASINPGSNNRTSPWRCHCRRSRKVTDEVVSSGTAHPGVFPSRTTFFFQIPSSSGNNCIAEKGYGRASKSDNTPFCCNDSKTSGICFILFSFGSWWGSQSHTATFFYSHLAAHGGNIQSKVGTLLSFATISGPHT